MDITTLAIVLSKISQLRKEVKKDGFNVQVEQDRSILNNSGIEKIIYLLPKNEAISEDGYDEFIYANGAWEKVGSTDIDLTNYYQKNEINNLLGLKEDILTEGQLINIIQQIYPESTLEEIEDMADSIVDSGSTTLIAMIDFILSHTASGQEGQYAPLQSPHFTGVPTAPTPPRGTNTNQVATTAFVQEAVKPVVLASVQDLPANFNLTITLTLQDEDIDYFVVREINSGEITSIVLDYAGEYLIEYSDNRIKGKKKINVSIPTIYTLNAQYSELVVYTLVIDKLNSNPETACSYADGAANMVKGGSAWDDMPIFKHIRPCVFQNGEVKYYLNPNDFTKKYNSNENAVLTGEDGDVMIEFPKFAYKIKTENNTITISITNNEEIAENDNDYTYDAFSRLTEGDLDYFYKGAFKGSLDNDGKLRSIIAAKPANNQTIAAFRSAARLNGQHYQQSTYAQLKALQCLYLVKYGNRDGQTAVGKGVVGASESYITGYNVIGVGSANNDNSTLKSGMTFGTTANSTTHMRLFGIEDFWGNIWELVDGLTTDGSHNLITSWNSFSGEDTTITSITTPSGVTSNRSGYVNNVIGNTAAGFMPINFSGSSSTYWADYGNLCASCVLFFGGRWNNGDDAGPFFLNASNGASTAVANVGARLSYV